MSAHSYLQKIIDMALALGAARVAVAYPCSSTSIEAALAAYHMGLIQPIMVGPRARIEAISREHGFDLGGVEFVETDDDVIAAAHASVRLCQEKHADVIMKGSLHSDELLAVILEKGSGLRTERRVSHAYVFDLPSYSKPLLISDCGVNINPGLMEKRDITQNTIDLAHALEIERPYVAVLSAVETINPAIPGTVDAAALSKMAERGQITGAQVEGPLSFDVAVSLEAANIKHINLRNKVRPDILIMPNLETGNMMAKQLVYLANADCAGILLGTKVPIVLTSRADSPRCRVASCALAVVFAHNRSLAYRKQ